MVVDTTLRVLGLWRECAFLPPRAVSRPRRRFYQEDSDEDEDETAAKDALAVQEEALAASLSTRVALSRGMLQTLGRLLALVAQRATAGGTVSNQTAELTALQVV